MLVIPLSRARSGSIERNYAPNSFSVRWSAPMCASGHLRAQTCTDVHRSAQKVNPFTISDGRTYSTASPLVTGNLSARHSRCLIGVRKVGYIVCFRDGERVLNGILWHLFLGECKLYLRLAFSEPDWLENA